ncbi:MAG: hypothetical protein ACR2PT_10325 [Endozoicomonas sp.]
MPVPPQHLGNYGNVSDRYCLPVTEKVECDRSATLDGSFLSQGKETTMQHPGLRAGLNIVLLVILLLVGSLASARELWLLVDSGFTGMRARLVTHNGDGTVVYSTELSGQGNIAVANTEAPQLFQQVLEGAVNALQGDDQITQIAIGAAGTENVPTLQPFYDSVSAAMNSHGIQAQPLIVQDFVAAALGAHNGQTGVTVLSGSGSLAGIVSPDGSILFRLGGYSPHGSSYGHNAFGRYLRTIVCNNYGVRNGATGFHHRWASVSGLVRSLEGSAGEGIDQLMRYPDHWNGFSQIQFGKRVRVAYLQARYPDPIADEVICMAVTALVAQLRELRQMARNNWPANLAITGSAGDALIPLLQPHLASLNLTLQPRPGPDVHFEGLRHLIRNHRRRQHQ